MLDERQLDRMVDDLISYFIKAHLLEYQSPIAFERKAQKVNKMRSTTTG